MVEIGRSDLCTAAATPLDGLSKTNPGGLKPFSEAAGAERPLNAPWSMRVFWRFTAIELKIYLRSGVALFWTFAFPIVILLVTLVAMGLPALRSFAPILVPGLISLGITTATLAGLLGYLIGAREARIYELFGLLRVPAVLLLSAVIASRLVISLLQAAMILAIAAALHLAPVVLSPWSYAAVLAAIAGGVLCMSFLAGAITTLVRSESTGKTIGSMLLYAFTLLGGSFFDSGVLSPVLFVLCSFEPVYHINTLLRGALYDGVFNCASLAVLSVFGALALLANTLFLDLNHKRN